MSQFEFFMTFYGLLLGLGTAELFGGFAGILRERQMPRLGLILPLMGLIALFEITATFIDAWANLRGIVIRLEDLVVPLLIGLSYFVLGVVMMPRHFEDWPDLDSYFDHRRRWIVGLFLVANLLVIATELPSVQAMIAAKRWDAVTWYYSRNTWLLGSYVLLLFSRRRWLDIAAATSVLIFYVFAYTLARRLFAGMF